MSNTDRFKFRVWNKSQRAYLVTEWIFLSRAGNLVYPRISDFSTNPTICSADVIGDNLVIEQCTGIRDKNGELIYEGDIVVQRNEYPYYDYAEGVEHKSLNETLCVIEHDAVPNYIGIVEWCEESAQFVIVLECVNPNKNGISNGCCHYFDDDENLEIIGNIHDKEGAK